MDKIKEITSNISNSLKSKRITLDRNYEVIKRLFVIIVPIIILIIIISIIISGIHEGECNDLYSDINTKVESYLITTGTQPNLNGDYVIIELSDIGGVKFKETSCTGNVKVTKVNDKFIKTYNLTNCGYCTTDFGKEVTNYNEKASNLDVIAYFNYYNVTNNSSPWSSYIPSEEISDEATMGTNLPIDEKDLPKISDEAIITSYEKEDLEYYSYRDKLYLWYQNKNSSYSDFSSEQPKGYANKDTKTTIKTDYTEWSATYPEVKEYRSIQSKTSYRWYKLNDDKEKVYWENGNYYPEMPEEGYTKENDNYITMYRYSDELYKWYNGTARNYYSNETATSPSSRYIYKDEDFETYTEWSNFKTVSYVNSSNKSYREEKINIYSRYKINYDLKSFIVLEDYVTLEKLETIIGKTYQEILEDTTLSVEIEFRYKY